MTVWQAMILGLVQGVTEFLPVSSSGHLVVVRALLGTQAEPLLFEIVVHVGTLFSVLLIFWRDIVSMLKHPLGKLVRYLIIATIPAVVVSLLFGDFVEETFSGRFLGIGFLITAALLTLSETRRVKNTRDFSRMNAVDPVIIGSMQAIALFPGISRSGSTIAGGLFRNLDRKLCARFSFLMSIPAILGSLVFKFKDLMSLGSDGTSVWALIVGALFAAFSGFLAVRYMIRMISRKKLYGFAIYVGALGIVVLVCQLFGVLFTPMFGI